MAELILERMNELRYVRYPFIEDALIDPLTNDVLLDLHGLVYTRDIGQLRLASLEVSSDESLVTATFIYEPAAGADVTVQVSVPSSAAAWAAIDYYQAQVLTTDLALYPTFGNGIVSFAAGRGGSTITFIDLYTEPACLCIRNKHIVTSMTSSSAVALTGDVKIMPGYNFAVAVIDRSNTIRLGAIVGEGEGIPCEEILDVSRNCGDLIYRINGQSPDWYGDFMLEGGPGMMITADKANHKIIVKTAFRACPGCRE